MKLAIIDIDGVIADNTIRANKAIKDAAAFADQDGTKDLEVFWATMFDPQLVETDVPIPRADEALLALLIRGYSVYLLTSRPESMRAATTAWLHQHHMCYGEMIMKNYETDRFTRTEVWKASQVKLLIASHRPEEVLFIDDEEKNRKAVQKLDAVMMLRVLSAI